jgi:hypothetical protein
MPEGAVYVGRPTKWGNPYIVGSFGVDDAGRAVDLFRKLLRYGDPEDYPSDGEIRAELRGKDLACFCPLHRPCHADVLLELANIDALPAPRTEQGDT